MVLNSDTLIHVTGSYYSVIVSLNRAVETKRALIQLRGPRGSDMNYIIMGSVLLLAIVFAWCKVALSFSEEAKYLT